MIEISKNELKMDEAVLKYATSAEIVTLRKIAKAVIERAKEGGVVNE